MCTLTPAQLHAWKETVHCCAPFVPLQKKVSNEEEQVDPNVRSDVLAGSPQQMRCFCSSTSLHPPSTPPSTPSLILPLPPSTSLHPSLHPPSTSLFIWQSVLLVLSNARLPICLRFWFRGGGGEFGVTDACLEARLLRRLYLPTGAIHTGVL